MGILVEGSNPSALEAAGRDVGKSSGHKHGAMLLTTVLLTLRLDASEDH
jgi:hypothetical protein